MVLSAFNSLRYYPVKPLTKTVCVQRIAQLKYHRIWALVPFAGLAWEAFVEYRWKR